MEYKKLEEINKLLKTTDIKGKNYIEVNERIKAFWKICENGKIETKILSLENNMCVIQALVFENKTDLNPRATGIAYEKEGSTFINKTSYIENCETSAVGRALGNAGIGIDTSVASAEEVQNAILQQDNEKIISTTQANALLEIIKKVGTEKDDVIATLMNKGYERITEIKMKDYMYFVEYFSKHGRN